MINRTICFISLALSIPLSALGTPLSGAELSALKMPLQTFNEALLYEHMGPTHPDHLSSQANRHARRGPDRFDALLFVLPTTYFVADLVLN